MDYGLTVEDLELIAEVTPEEASNNLTNENPKLLMSDIIETIGLQNLMFLLLCLSTFLLGR